MFYNIASEILISIGTFVNCGMGLANMAAKVFVTIVGASKHFGPHLERESHISLSYLLNTLSIVNYYNVPQYIEFFVF